MTSVPNTKDIPFTLSRAPNTTHKLVHNPSTKSKIVLCTCQAWADIWNHQLSVVTATDTLPFNESNRRYCNFSAIEVQGLHCQQFNNCTSGIQIKSKRFKLETSLGSSFCWQELCWATKVPYCSWLACCYVKGVVLQICRQTAWCNWGCLNVLPSVWEGAVLPTTLLNIYTQNLMYRGYFVHTCLLLFTASKL